MVDLQFVVSDKDGKELGFAKELSDMDMDLGDKNDFETRVNLTETNKEKYNYGYRIFIPGTEYGGIIRDIQVLTESNEMILRGPSFRGVLGKKIVEPPDGEAYLILDGELNDVIREIIGERFGSFFVVPNTNTGITVSNWKVNRYVSVYSAIVKLVEAYGYKIQIAYIQPEGLDYGYVEVQAKPVIDYSEEIEYSKESKINMNVRDYRDGINHLICLGSGEGAERMVIHLYVQEDGSIGKNPYFIGIDEAAETYDYSNAESEEELVVGGAERLRELQNYKQAEIFVNDNEDYEIGDIISGYEAITNTQVQKPIVQKILKISNGNLTIEYNVKGDD